jgi:hypothetical protein
MMNFKYSSDEMNEMLHKLADRNDLFEIEDLGKAIMYFGWYWRDVNFDSYPYTIARTDDGLNGFCENNKWGYPEITITEEQSIRIRLLLESVIDKQTSVSLSIFNAYLQSLR